MNRPNQLRSDSILQELFDLSGQVAIVTGGTGQLGASYARALARAGASVAVFDIRLPKEAIEHEGMIKYYETNITDRTSLEYCLAQVEKDLGTPTILINNAALDAPPNAPASENGPFENYPLESWNQVLNTNLTGVFLCCQVIGGCMAKNGGGSIINIASTYGLVSPNQNIYSYRAKQGEPFFKPIAYCASKSGIFNLTRYLATYWAKQNVRVNTLTPGGVANKQDETFVKNYCEHVPLGRMAQSHEYDGAILFLASKASSYMTGSNLVIDGGWTAW